MIGQAYALKTRALVKLGELLKELPKQAGGRGARGGGRNRGSKKELQFDAPATLADYKLDKKTSHIAQQLAALPEATREATAQREVTLSQARRDPARTRARMVASGSG